MLAWQSEFTPCIHSDKLIRKAEQLNANGSQINIDYIKKAIFYAKKYHGTQLRKSGEPYYSHPLEVAYLVADHLQNTNLLIISILHDTIEDTSLTSQMIAYIFNPTVARGVVDLTRIKEGKKCTAADTIISLWNQKKYDLLMIKLFDRLHNIRTLAVKSPQSIEKISKETIEIFISVAMHFELKNVEQELTTLAIHYYNTTRGYEDFTPYGSDENFLISLNIKSAEFPI